MNWSSFKRFITLMLYWMQCTHQFSHMQKYQCVNRCCDDFTNMIKLLVSSYNRFDVAIVYFIIYVIVYILNELTANQFFYQLQWFRSQIFRIDLHQSSKCRYFYSHRKSDRNESLSWSKIKSAEQFPCLDQSASRFSSVKYFQMICHII